MGEHNIILCREDHLVLKRLVDSLARTGRLGQPHFGRLADEVSHATIVDRDDLPSMIVTIGSRVSYTCVDTATTSQVTLVFPADATEAESHVSILAPLGLALIGEREGAEIDYEAPGGTFRIRLNSVEHTRVNAPAG